MSETIETLERIRALLPLLRQITVRQALDAGDDVINACGLNPWCVNEGRANGSEPAISSWRYDDMCKVLDREIAFKNAHKAIANRFNVEDLDDDND